MQLPAATRAVINGRYRIDSPVRDFARYSSIWYYALLVRAGRAKPGRLAFTQSAHGLKSRRILITNEFAYCPNALLSAHAASIHFDFLHWCFSYSKTFISTAAISMTTDDLFRLLGLASSCSISLMLSRILRAPLPCRPHANTASLLTILTLILNIPIEATRQHHYMPKLPARHFI
jgi:hypothetical protein